MKGYDNFYAEVSEKDGFDSIMYIDVCRSMEETKNLIKREVKKIGASIGRGGLSIIWEKVYEKYGFDGLKIMAHRMVLGYIYKYLFNEKRFAVTKITGKVFHETREIPLSQRSMMIGEVLRGKSFDNVYIEQKYKKLKTKLDTIIRNEGLTGLYQALKDRDIKNSVKEVFGEKIIKIMNKWNIVHTASSKIQKYKSPSKEAYNKLREIVLKEKCKIVEEEKMFSKT